MVADARDRAGDDLALDEEARDARVDQAGAELVEVEDAGDEDDERGEVEDDDTTGEARKDVQPDEAAEAAMHASRTRPARLGRGRVAYGLVLGRCRHRVAWRRSPRRQTSLKR